MRQNKNIGQLLTPSWITNFIGVTVGVLATGAVIVLSGYQSSSLRQQIFEVRANQTTDTTGGLYQNIVTNVTNNSFLGSLPLLLTWAAVGVVVYFFAVSIARSFGQAADLRDQLGYVHSSRQALLRETIFHLVVRILTVVLWFAFIKASLSVLVPYAFASASVAADSLSVANIGYALLAAAVLYADVYMHTIFLRLITLRTRVFG